MASLADRKLARTLYGIAHSWRTYDRDAQTTALVWVKRLNAAQPSNGRETAVALVNFDHMRAGARVAYDAGAQERADLMFEAWQDYRITLPGIAA